MVTQKMQSIRQEVQYNAHTSRTTDFWQLVYALFKCRTVVNGIPTGDVIARKTHALLFQVVNSCTSLFWSLSKQTYMQMIQSNMKESKNALSDPD